MNRRFYFSCKYQYLFACYLWVHYYQTRYRFYNYKSHSNDEAICLLINGSLSVNFTNCRRDRDRMAVGLTTTYLSNQCLSPLMLWVRISIRARCTTLCDKVCPISNIYINLHTVEIFYLISFFMNFLMEMNKFIIHQILECHI